MIEITPPPECPVSIKVLCGGGVGLSLCIWAIADFVGRSSGRYNTRRYDQSLFGEIKMSHLADCGRQQLTSVHALKRTIACFLIGRLRLHPLPFSGGPAYAILFWVTYALWIVLETIGSRTKRSRDTSKARDRGSFRLIMLLLWLALGLDFALSVLLPQATILWKRTSLFFIGITLMFAGRPFVSTLCQFWAGFLPTMLRFTLAKP